MNHREVEQLMRAVKALWPTVPYQFKIDADAIQIWQVVLSDVPIDGALAVVAMRSRAGESFPPAPGAIVQQYHELRAVAQGDAIPDADEAWSQVRREISRHGYHSPQDVDLSHPAIYACVRAIGWRELCHGDEMVNRAHFLKLYPTIAARERRQTEQSMTLAALGNASHTPQLES